MNFAVLHSGIDSKRGLTISLLLLFVLQPYAVQAANKLSVAQLNNTLASTWGTLLRVTNCNRKPPQDSQCIKTYHGKTIKIKLFGEPVNALILFETFTTTELSGTLISQQAGFLIGPINGYAYKIINEKTSVGVEHKRRVKNNGLRVFAHTFKGNSISPQGIELNNGQQWLDGKYGSWIYHWTALAQANEALKQIKINLEYKYKREVKLQVQPLT